MKVILRRMSCGLRDRLLGALLAALGTGGVWLFWPRGDPGDLSGSDIVVLIGPLVIPVTILYLPPMLFAVVLTFVGLGQVFDGLGSWLGTLLSRLALKVHIRLRNVEGIWRVLCRNDPKTRTVAKRMLAEIGAPAVPQARPCPP